MFSHRYVWWVDACACVSDRSPILGRDGSHWERTQQKEEGIGQGKYGFKMRIQCPGRFLNGWSVGPQTKGSRAHTSVACSITGPGQGASGRQPIDVSQTHWFFFSLSKLMGKTSSFLVWGLKKKENKWGLSVWVQCGSRILNSSRSSHPRPSGFVCECKGLHQ